MIRSRSLFRQADGLGTPRPWVLLIHLHSLFFQLHHANSYACDFSLAKSGAIKKCGVGNVNAALPKVKLSAMLSEPILVVPHDGRLFVKRPWVF